MVNNNGGGGISLLDTRLSRLKMLLAEPESWLAKVSVLWLDQDSVSQEWLDRKNASNWRV